MAYFCRQQCSRAKPRSPPLKKQQVSELFIICPHAGFQESHAQLQNVSAHILSQCIAVWGREFLSSNSSPSMTLKTGTVALFFSLPIKLHIFHPTASKQSPIALKKICKLHFSHLTAPFMVISPPWASFRLCSKSSNFLPSI